MTGAQKAWLDAHPEYEIVGQLGGRIAYVERGVLHPDGTFARGKGPYLGDVRENGPFAVGKKRLRDPGRPLELSDPRGTQAPPTAPGTPGMAVAPPSPDPHGRQLPRKV
jgi:hypothetical protein